MKKIKRCPLCQFDIEIEKQICQDYLNGEGGATYLKNKYKARSVSTIYQILKAYNIERRNLSEARRTALKYSVDETSFTNYSDPETCYWIGVMYTDGFLTKTNLYTNYFGLSVQEKDNEWLDKFKKYLKYTGEIHHYKVSAGYKPGAPYVRLCVGNNQIVKNLEQVGVVEHKTKIINHIPSQLLCMDDFIRGVIDGDGSLRKEYPNLRICGNYDFLIDIANYFGYPYKIYKDKSIYDLVYNAEESRILEKRLYKNACVYLDRKYNIAKRSF